MLVLCFCLKIIAIVIASRHFLSCTCRDRVFSDYPPKHFSRPSKDAYQQSPRKRHWAVKISRHLSLLFFFCWGEGGVQNDKKKVAYVFGHIPGSQKISFAVALKELIIAA